jgi:CDP-glycerol glycerophosphotransferase
MKNYRDYSKLRNLVTIFTHNLSFLLSFFIRKKEHIWIFGEKQGTLYSGNAKYLFLYILKNQSNIRPIWLTNKYSIQDEVQKANGECYLINSIKAFYFGLYAKVYVFSVGLTDIGNYALKNAKVINLWHGMPLKNLNNSSRLQQRLNPKYKMSYQNLVAKLTGNITPHFDMLISTSESTKVTIEKSFPHTRIYITGEPKNDIFFQKISRNDILKKYDLLKYAGNTIITYLPTHRLGKSYRPLFIDNPEIEKLDDVLILEKSHANDAELAKHQIVRKNILNISNMIIDTQELLFITDILITDYSSCYIDYLLTEKPIIFYPYDLDYYQKEIGFYYDYSEVTPGFVVQDEKSLIKAIRDCKNNYSTDLAERKRIKNRFHKFQDGDYSQRVYREIIKLLGSKKKI